MRRIYDLAKDAQILLVRHQLALLHRQADPASAELLTGPWLPSYAPK